MNLPIPCNVCGECIYSNCVVAMTTLCSLYMYEYSDEFDCTSCTVGSGGVCRNWFVLKALFL